MSTSDLLLAATFDIHSGLPSESSIEKCCVHNIDYARTYDEKIYLHRAIPSKHLAIVTCMDARLDPCQMLGLRLGEAHIIRNGGGRLRDAVRSLVYTQTLLQTKEVMIIHHTDCGFTYFKNNDQIFASLIVKSGTQPNSLHDCRPMYEGDKPDFMPIRDSRQAIRDDLREYKQYPMLNQDILVRGFLYDTKTGLLEEIQG